MTEADIPKEVMRGRLVVVGELRGTHAESTGYVDRRTGEAIKYVRVIYLIECACRGMLDRAVVTQKWTGVEEPELVNLPYEKGKLTRFFWPNTAEPPKCLSSIPFPTHAEPRRGDVATTTK